MPFTMKYSTALNAASRIARRQGKITREEFQSIQDCLADQSPDCACADCEAVSIQTAEDSGALTAEQAENPKAINWANLLAFITQIMAIIMALINPPKPTPPTPSLPSGNGG